jgi:Peptidase C65 Otubain
MLPSLLLLAFRDRYTGFRNVAGDGNCYYRVVFYGALERHLLAGDYSAVAAIYEKVLAVH